jgi:hypothetical protein
MREIKPSKAFFIKLGSGGCFEPGCIERDQTIRLGFNETDHTVCLKGDWKKIHSDLLKKGRTKGKATEITNEIRYFYEADENTLWVTFFANRMWWAFAKTGVTQLPDKSKTRKIIGKWRSTDIRGANLSLDKVSGRFLQVRRFQGTICSIDLEYAKNKINGIKPIIVEKAETAVKDLENRLIPLIRSLTWQDFELLVDLIFSNAGWQRIGVLGKAQKSLDIELRAPVTGEHVMVQIKSASGLDEYKRCYREFSQSDFTKLFYVVHSPDANLDKTNELPNSTIIKAKELAKLVVNAGLSSWLIEKNT